MTAADFSSRPWWTPNQIRDYLLSWPVPDTERIRHARALATEETERRKQAPGDFIHCPRCYGWHGQILNLDSLCETCEQLTAPVRYDARATP